MQKGRWGAVVAGQKGGALSPLCPYTVVSRAEGGKGRGGYESRRAGGTVVPRAEGRRGRINTGTRADGARWSLDSWTVVVDKWGYKVYSYI